MYRMRLITIDQFCRKYQKDYKYQNMIQWDVEQV